MTQPDPVSVIFDMDGVLVDSNPAHHVTFSLMGEKYGVPFTWEMMLGMVGMHNNEIIPRWLGKDYPGLTPERIDEISREKEALYREKAAATLQPVPGVVELVRALHAAGFPLAVGSSGPRENVELAMEVTGVKECFPVRVTGSDVRRGKPAPDIFLKAAELLGQPPARCVVIEDAPQGVQAALNAGMKVIAVTTSKPAAELRAAHLVVESLAEVTPAVVRELVDPVG